MPKRVLARLPDDAYEKLSKWAAKLGVSLSQLAGMAIQAGLDSIIRSVDPVNSVPAEKWAEIVIAMKEAGIEVKSEKK